MPCAEPPGCRLLVTIGSCPPPAVARAVAAEAVPSIAGAVAGVLAYRMLREAAGLPATTVVEAEPPPSPAMRGYDRRRFLRAGIAAAGITALAGGLGRLLTTRANAAASRATATIPEPTDPDQEGELVPLAERPDREGLQPLGSGVDRGPTHRDDR